MELLVRAMQFDLRENAEEFQRLANLVPTVGPGVSSLRMLDIVVWMSSAV
jgi:hypothetical protein